MAETQTLRGVATISFFADDVAAAQKWYSELLGMAPYFQRPTEGPAAYIEYRLGDYQQELGIVDRKYAPKGAGAFPGGAFVYWYVDDLKAMVEKVIAMGATECEPITERGQGFITASVIDPFGNVLGLMSNPHYLDVFGSMKKA